MGRKKGNRRLFRMKGVGNEPGEEIEEKIGGRTMTGMVNLLEVFKLVENGFDEGAFAQPKFIEKS